MQRKAIVLSKDECLTEITQLIVKREGDEAYRKQFLTNFSDSTLTPQEKIECLASQGQDGWTLCMSVARNQDAATTQQYLRLLGDSLQAGVAAPEIIALLNLQINEGWTFGSSVARYQDAATTQQYLRLLANLRQAGVPAIDVMTLIKFQTNKGHTFIDFVAISQDVATKYELINHDLLPLEECGKFAAYQDEIRQYLFSFRRDAKMAALNNALNKDHPLGKFFYALAATNAKQNHLQLISAELNKMTQSVDALLEFHDVHPQCVVTPPTNTDLIGFNEEVAELVSLKDDTTGGSLYPKLDVDDDFASPPVAASLPMYATSQTFFAPLSERQSEDMKMFGRVLPSVPTTLPVVERDDKARTPEKKAERAMVM